MQGLSPHKPQILGKGTDNRQKENPGALIAKRRIMRKKVWAEEQLGRRAEGRTLLSDILLGSEAAGESAFSGTSL